MKYLKTIICKAMQHYSNISIDEKLSKKFYENIYNKLPVFFKKISFRIFYSFKLKILVRTKYLKLPVFSVVGKEKYSNSELKILFFGEKNSVNYFSNIFFSDNPVVEYLDIIYIWNLSKFLRKYSNKPDIIIVKTDIFFTNFLQSKGFNILPEWAEMELDISGSIDNIFKKISKSAKDDVRKIKVINYKYELSSNVNMFKDFYHKIYYPFIIKRHKDLTISDATNFPEIKVKFDNGYLFLVKDKEKVVSGFIISSFGKTAFFTYAGVEPKNKYLSKGAGSALYYFFIYWAKEQGFNLLKFGGVRPFFNDGLFKYKKKWGMTIKISSDMFGIFGIKIINFKSKAISDFLIKNPYVYIDKKELKGIIFVKEKLNFNIIQQIWKKFYIPGLSKLIVVSFKNIDDDVRLMISSKYGNKIVLRENLFY